MHPPATCRETSPDAARDVPLCDPVSRQTTPPAQPCRPQDDRRAHTSTSAPSWSSHFPAPAPVLECRPRAPCQLPSHSHAALLPTVRLIGCWLLPNPPSSSVPVPPLDGHRSATGDTAADGHSTSTPAHAPTIPALPLRGRGDGSALPPEQCSRTGCNSASCAHGGSPRNWRARIPVSPKHLRPVSVTPPGSVGTPFLSDRVGAFVAEDDRARRGARASLLSRPKTLGTNPVLPAWALARYASTAVPPAAVPTARSVAPAFPTCVQTACDAAWITAASDARSHARG